MIKLICCSSKNYYHNKNVFIVGGSSGIGLCIAQQLMKKGAHVHIFARRQTTLDQALVSIDQFRLNAQQHLGASSLDVTDEASIQNAFSIAINKMSSVEIIINCAGAAKPDYYQNIDAQEFNTTITRNLIGVRNVSVCAIPHLKDNGGQLVNTSSIAGFIGIFGYTDYCASKFAIVGFCEALQMEVKKHHIHISVLCPPDTQTPGFEQEELQKPWETRAISAGTKLRTADYVANLFLKKLTRKKPLICCGWDSQATLLLKRFCPALLLYLMEKNIQKASVNHKD